MALVVALAGALSVAVAGCGIETKPDSSAFSSPTTSPSPTSPGGGEPAPASTAPVDPERPRARLNETEPFDHWHEAFAVSICGTEQAPLEDAQPDELGIHTHGDGFIHIHPFTLGASGPNATLSKFFDQTGVVVTDDTYRSAAGKIYKAGQTTCDGKATELVLAHWDDATQASGTLPDQVITSHLSATHFDADAGSYTLALVVKGERDIAAPSSSTFIGDLTDGG